MTLCKYADIFGKPNTGVHSYRLFDFAIVDVLLTILVGYLISKYYNKPMFSTIFYLFIIGIFIHELFCVKTKLNTLLFY